MARGSEPRRVLSLVPAAAASGGGPTVRLPLLLHPCNPTRNTEASGRPQILMEMDFLFEQDRSRLLLEQAGGHERAVVDLPDDLLLAGVVLHDVLSAGVGRGRGLALGGGIAVALVRVAP